jgi:hypothetical protein
MTHRVSRTVTAALFVSMCALSSGAALAQEAAAGSDELVGNLTKELSVTPEQARGGAGTLFSLAKGKMPSTDFGKVSSAVPGMDGLLKAAPAMGGGGGMASLGTMAAAASAFQKLGLAPAMVSKFIPVLTNFVGAKGGPEVAKLLAAALK